MSAMDLSAGGKSSGCATRRSTRGTRGIARRCSTLRAPARRVCAPTSAESVFPGLMCETSCPLISMSALQTAYDLGVQLLAVDNELRVPLDPALLLQSRETQRTPPTGA